jgi:hypothetical protein
VGNVDADLGHDGNRFRVDGRGIRPGRKSRNPVSQVMIDKPLGHLGTAGIAGAPKKGFDCHKRSRFYSDMQTKHNSESMRSIVHIRLRMLLFYGSAFRKYPSNQTLA